MHSLAADPEGLKNKLLATGDRELVEASRFDRVWGVGFTREQLRMGKKGGYGREKWGENLLGKALMAARGRIRGEEREKEMEKETEKERARAEVGREKVVGEIDEE